MRVCYMCKVLLKKNQGNYHIFSYLMPGSQKRLICDSCRVRFHEDLHSFSNKYSKKYLKKIRGLTFNSLRLEKISRKDMSYNNYLKEYFNGSIEK